MTKEQLRAYRDLKRERDRLRGMISELEGVIYSPTIPRLDAAPGGGRPGDSPVERAAGQHEQLLTRYRRKDAELTQALLVVEEAIETLQPRERDLVRLYYCRGLTWDEVCEAMHFSWSTVHRIHSDALKALRTKTDERERTKCE